ncbi:hypothetical protein CBE37_01535 [bacterium TMED277]|nr:hypothetical protein [Candidatus Pelagibacter sp.]OUX44227.1 MAG: hypothetical protein CBE37_01535 [bacterium TMED277]|tara:strand:- start:8126 stop:9268 length:1143 start_codon:yes stop_codon:yes gene_type:complete
MIINKINKIVNSKFLYNLPKIKNVLILDYGTCQFYKSFFGNNVEILKTRGEEYYIRILISSFFSWFKYRNFSFGQLYIINSIKYINPNYILTFNDLNPFFLSLKKIFPEKKLILFQSSQRSFITLKGIQESLKKNKVKKYNVDAIFIWGEYYKKYFSLFSKAKYYVSGSIKNNMFMNKPVILKKHISFISQFRMHNRKPGFMVDTNEFTKKKILKTLSKFCKVKGIKLYIIGQQSKDYGVRQEELYYSKLFKDTKFVYYSKKNYLSSYLNSLKLNNFLTFSSSLGLELISRGKKVSFLKIQKDRFPKSIYKQYLFNLKNNGKNWTSKTGEKELFKYFNILTNARDLAFRKIYNKDFKKYIIYDKKNQKTKNYLKKIGLKI